MRSLVLTLLLALLAGLPVPAQLRGASLAESYCQRGLQLAKEGKLPAAQVEFERALELRQDLVVAHWHLFRFALTRNDLLVAFDRLREVLALEPSYHNADRVFGELVAALPRAIRERLRRDPRDPEAHQMLGFILVRAGRTQEGIAKLEAAAGLDPRRATVYDDLAWAHYRLRSFKAAFEYSEKAFNLSPERPSVSAHHKKLFYLNRFASDSLRADAFDDWYPAPPSGGASSSPSSASSPPQASPTPTASPATRPSTSGADVDAVDDPFRAGDAVIDFARVDVDDQALVDQLMGGIEASAPATAPASAADVVVVEPPPVAVSPPPVKVPSPLQILKNLEASYRRGEEALAADRFDEARTAFRSVLDMQAGFRDARQLHDQASKLAEAKAAVARGQDLMASGAYDRAEETFRDIDTSLLRRAAGLVTVDGLVGECLFKAGKYARAIGPLTAWLQTKPDDARFRYMLARSLFAEGRFAEASDELSRAHEGDPADLAEFSDRGSFGLKLFIKKNILWLGLAALAWIGAVLGYLGFKVKRATSEETFREGFLSLARLTREEKWKEALELCDTLEKAGPGPLERYRVDFARAQALLGDGHVRAARTLCEKLLEAYPQDGMGHQLMARIYAREGAVTEDAAAEYRALLLLEPNNVPCLELLNQFLRARDATDGEAEKVLSTLMELRPESGEFGLQLCQLYLRQGRADAVAEGVFRSYLSREPESADVREGLARCLLGREHWLEALKEANGVLKLEPRRISACEILVQCHRRLDLFDEAVKRFRGLAERYPDEPFFAATASALEDEAREHKARVTAERREGEDVAQYYNRGVKLYGEGRYADALAPLQAAFRSEKFRLHSAALLIRTHLRLKDSAAARRVFESLDVLGRTYTDEFVVDLAYEMAGVYAAEGRKADALALYRYVCGVDTEFKDAFKRLENLQEELKLGGA